MNTPSKPSRDPGGRVSDAIWSEESGPDGGPLVVLIHGAMDRSAGLLKLSRRLDETCCVARYDRRGYGRSAPHAGPFDIPGQVADLMSVLDGRSAVLFGHSYGGNVALAAAVRRPELVRAVAIYESPMSWTSWWPTTTAGATALGSRHAADAAEAFMRRLIGDERWERLPSRTREARRREGVTMIGELADLRDHEPWRGKDVHVPVVAMRGSGGAEHHRHGIEVIAGAIPGCEVVVVEGARHFGPNTHPDAVAAVVRRLVIAES